MPTVVSVVLELAGCLMILLDDFFHQQNKWSIQWFMFFVQSILLCTVNMWITFYDPKPYIFSLLASSPIFITQCTLDLPSHSVQAISMDMRNGSKTNTSSGHSYYTLTKTDIDEQVHMKQSEISKLHHIISIKKIGIIKTCANNSQKFYGGGEYANLTAIQEVPNLYLGIYIGFCELADNRVAVNRECTVLKKNLSPCWVLFAE